jgi:hypothetical protein
MRRLTLAPALSLRARPLRMVKTEAPASDLEATRKVLSSSDVVPSLRGRGVDTGVFARGADEDATNFYAVRALSPETLMGAVDDQAPCDALHAVEATLILASRPATQVPPVTREVEEIDAELDASPSSVTMIDAAPPFVEPAPTPFVFSLVDAYAPEPAPAVPVAVPMAASVAVPMRPLAPTMAIPRQVAPRASRRIWPVVALFVTTFGALASAFVLTMPGAGGASSVATGKSAPVVASLDATPRLASSPLQEIDSPVAAPPAVKTVAVAPRPRPHVAPRPAKVEAPTESEELAKKQIDAL